MTAHDLGETIQAKVLSLADWTRPGVARAIGTVLSSEPGIAFERWGRADPARQRIPASLADFLDEWSPRFATSDNELFFDGPRAWCSVGACPATAGAPIADFLRDRCFNSIEWVVAERWVLDHDAGETYGRLFAELCDAADAFYGSAASYSFRSQEMQLSGQSRDAGLVEHVDLRDPKHPHARESYYVDDIRWLNYFGPAYVERWGADRFERVGARLTWVRNGGVVVWATVGPPAYEPVDRVDGYAWKRSFYEQLDSDAFFHEGFRPGRPGEHVPSMDDHRRHLRAGERAS